MTIAIPPLDAPPLDQLWWQAGSSPTKPDHRGYFGALPIASANASWSHFRDTDAKPKCVGALPPEDSVGRFEGIRDGGLRELSSNTPRELPSDCKETHVACCQQHPIGSRSSEQPSLGHSLDGAISDHLSDTVAPSGPPLQGLGDEGNKDSSDDEASEDLNVLHAVVEHYMSGVRVPGPPDATGITGRTLMVHDLLNKFKVEPDLMNLFTTVGVIDDVEYVYLPLTYLKTGQNRKNNNKSSRNKGYGFVHFSRDSAADRFAQLIQNVCLVGTGRGVKQMHTTPAKFQGVCANLVELLDLSNDEWRPKQGYLYIRRNPGFFGPSLQPLERVGISSLRKYILHSRD